MVNLTSAELRDRIKAAGIKYLPAEQVFYNNYPYKVELSLRFKGMGGVSGFRGCKIPIDNPDRARHKLAEFNEMMEKVISNVEYRNSIREFVNGLPNVEYKCRMGGKNNLFYFREPETVMILIDRYHDVINSVTGPVNKNHQDTMDERNIVMREKLYYGKYRYVLEFPFIDEFVSTARLIMDYLHGLDKDQWRANRLDTCIDYYNYHAAGGLTGNGRWRRRRTARRLGSPIISTTVGLWPAATQKGKIHLYLADGNDYIYIKMLASEFILCDHKVVLFDELT